MKKVAVIVAVLAGLAALCRRYRRHLYPSCRRCDDYCSVEIPFGQN